MAETPSTLYGFRFFLDKFFFSSLVKVHSEVRMKFYSHTYLDVNGSVEV